MSNNQNTPTNRMVVDQLANKNGYTATPTFIHDGPEHNRRYQCTYTLGGTTSVHGGWETTMGAAKESAAAEAIKLLRLWGKVGTFFLQALDLR